MRQRIDEEREVMADHQPQHASDHHRAPEITDRHTNDGRQQHVRADRQLEIVARLKCQHRIARQVVDVRVVVDATGVLAHHPTHVREPEAPFG